MSIAELLFDNLYWVFLGMILLNILQRRHGGEARKKRFATLYLAVALFLMQVYSGIIARQELGDLWLIPGVAVVLGALVVFREHTLPFRFRCAVSGKPLDFNTFLYKDSNTLPEFEAPESEWATEEEDGEEADADGRPDERDR